MCSKVLKEPTRSLQEIYEEVRSRCTEEMDSNNKLLFLQDFPSFYDIKTVLGRKRREVIPADPKVISDIDLNLPVFLYKDGESVVKGEQVLSDERRIILFTTNEEDVFSHGTGSNHPLIFHPSIFPIQAGQCYFERPEADAGWPIVPDNPWHLPRWRQSHQDH